MGGERDGDGNHGDSAGGDAGQANEDLPPDRGPANRGEGERADMRSGAAPAGVEQRGEGPVDGPKAPALEVGADELRAQPLAGGDDQRLLEAWNEARDEQYRELAGECAKFLAEIDHEFEIEKFTLAELDEEEAELDKLQRWHERIQRLDIYGASGAAAAAQALRDAHAALARYSTAVFEHTQP